MKRSFLSAILAIALAAGFVSCKDDKENDGGLTSTSIGLFINEVASQPNPDKIELYNSTDKEIDLSGYVLQDDKGAAEEWIMPNGTKIAAKGFILFTNGVDFPFGLSSGGDKVMLFNSKGIKIDEIAIPAMTGGSYTRSTDGGATWVHNSDKHTLGVSNGSAPVTPPDEPTPDPTIDYAQLIINEVDGNTKFVEIYNKGSVAISLEGVTLQKDDDGTVWTGQAGETIVAGGYYATGTNGDTKTNAACNDTRLTKGISTKKSVRFQLFIGEELLSEFTRGTDFGADASDQAPYSFSRMPDNSFKLATPTCNAANGASQGNIPQE
ncbi:MAG: lamin tail domain-containing protein [Prevotellaceae bacterium]|jgi:hypothetical protein|nr:lamin tail domain-containing protein [Prevotellaceae bacterium]